MHIVFVTHAYPRWDGDVAGTFIERLATALVAREHRVTVFTPADEGRGGPERRSGVDVLWVRYAPAERETLAHRGTMVDTTRSIGGKIAALSLVLALARPIRRLARNKALDIVHAHWWAPGGVATRYALRGKRTPYVVTMHGTDVTMLRGSRALRRAARKVLEDAAAVTAVSSFLLEEAARAVELPLTESLIQPMPADLVRLTNRSEGGGGVVTVGRLVPQKRIDVVIEAMARLREQGREATLTIIGEGPLRSALEERAAQLGVADTTRFLGEVEPSRLSGAIGNADVFAFAAESEGLGLAAAEALMLGIPVVATEGGGGVKDVVPTRGAGRVVPEGNPAAMADAVAELIDDPDANRLAAEAGERLRTLFEPDSVAQRFEALYEKLRGATANRA
jgi:glycosyltransferase involved in cell wall biosynthesis